MKRENLTFQKGFRVSVGNDRSQGTVMVLATGGCEGGPENRHKEPISGWRQLITFRGIGRLEKQDD
jgi:hypothetical protein